jgi:hypothetical protein
MARVTGRSPLVEAYLEWSEIESKLGLRPLVWRGMVRLRGVHRLALLAAVGWLQLASVASAEGPPVEPPMGEIDRAMLERLGQVLSLVIDHNEKAREIAAGNLESIDQLSPYARSCVHLLVAIASQRDHRYEEAEKSFERGLAFGPEGSREQDNGAVRDQLLQMYGQGELHRTDLEREFEQERERERQLEEILKRSRSYPREPYVLPRVRPEPRDT